MEQNVQKKGFYESDHLIMGRKIELGISRELTVNIRGAKEKEEGIRTYKIIKYEKFEGEFGVINSTG